MSVNLALLSRDLQTLNKCESCVDPVSKYIVFISPKIKKGGVCALFHLCEQCSKEKFDFGEEFEYEIIRKFNN